MNNTYGFAITKETAEKYKHARSSRDLKKVPVDQRTFCVESELINRPDGLKGMLEKYGSRWAARACPQGNLKTFQTGAIYDATAKGECNFGEVFTTDGRIVALDLKVLEDDRNFFPKYNVSLVLNAEASRSTRRSPTWSAPVARKLTNKVLLQLNAQIDVEGQEPADVAYKWLKKEGFVTDQ